MSRALHYRRVRSLHLNLAVDCVGAFKLYLITARCLASLRCRYVPDAGGHPGLCPGAFPAGLQQHSACWSSSLVADHLCYVKRR